MTYGLIYVNIQSYIGNDADEIISFKKGILTMDMHIGSQNNNGSAGAKSAGKASFRARLEADYGLRNCFTIAFDPAIGKINTGEGIILKKMDGAQPRYAMTIGSRVMPRDGGRHSALHHFADKHAIMVAAEIHTTERANGDARVVLRQPSEQQKYAVVKVDAMIPHKFERPTLAGVVTDGESLLSFVGKVNGHMRNEALVRLCPDNDDVTILFEDGTAKRFMFVGNELIEEPLTEFAYANALVSAGHAQLAEIASIKDDELRGQIEANILSRVANALCAPGMGKIGRVELLTNFFKQLGSRQLDRIHKKVFAIIAEHDEDLLPLLRNSKPKLVTKSRRPKTNHTPTQYQTTSQSGGETAIGAAMMAAMKRA